MMAIGVTTNQLPNIIFNSNIICNWIDSIIDGMVDGAKYHTLGLYKIEVVIPIVFTQEMRWYTTDWQVAVLLLDKYNLAMKSTI